MSDIADDDLVRIGEDARRSTEAYQAQQKEKHDSLVRLIVDSGLHAVYHLLSNGIQQADALARQKGSGYRAEHQKSARLALARQAILTSIQAMVGIHYQGEVFTAMLEAVGTIPEGKAYTIAFAHGLQEVQYW